MRLHVLLGHTAEINSLALLPDQRHVASTSENGVLNLWDLRSGKCAASFDFDTALTCCAIVKGEQTRMVVGTNDGRLRFVEFTGSKAPAHGA